MIKLSEKLTSYVTLHSYFFKRVINVITAFALAGLNYVASIILTVHNVLCKRSQIQFLTVSWIT
jgi:ABC-type multidrug transport system permease subunit